MSGSSWYSSADTHICADPEGEPAVGDKRSETDLLERTETCQNAASDPGRVLALRGRVDFNLPRRLSDAKLHEPARGRTLMSLSASFLTSFNSRSPNPRHSVLPPLRTTFENRLLRRSRSVRFMASTTTWCTPAYSAPISSGLKRTSGARNRSGPSCDGVSAIRSRWEGHGAPGQCCRLGV